MIAFAEAGLTPIELQPQNRLSAYWEQSEGGLPPIQFPGPSDQGDEPKFVMLIYTKYAGLKSVPLRDDSRVQQICEELIASGFVYRPGGETHYVPGHTIIGVRVLLAEEWAELRRKEAEESGSSPDNN